MPLVSLLRAVRNPLDSGNGLDSRRVRRRDTGTSRGVPVLADRHSDDWIFASHNLSGSLPVPYSTTELGQGVLVHPECKDSRRIFCPIDLDLGQRLTNGLFGHLGRDQFVELPAVLVTQLVEDGLCQVLALPCFEVQIRQVFYTVSNGIQFSILFSITVCTFSPTLICTFSLVLTHIPLQI